MRTLGIDPGTRITGFACIESDPARPADAPILIDAGVFRFKGDTPLASRLVELERDLKDIVAELKPSAAAIEKLYAHYQHPTTAITMGHARGVIMLVLARMGVPTIELPSTEVKKSVTGNGHASKEQVGEAVRVILGLPSVPQPADISDAMAIALTAGQRVNA